MGLPIIYALTHDSIGLGEDGPTHQPVEHIPTLRSIPGLLVFRPADALETSEAWDFSLTSSMNPIVICLSRQKIKSIRTRCKYPNYIKKKNDFNLTSLGAYVLYKSSNDVEDIALIATGSEVQIALNAAYKLFIEDNLHI